MKFQIPVNEMNMVCGVIQDLDIVQLRVVDWRNFSQTK